MSRIRINKMNFSITWFLSVVVALFLGHSTIATATERYEEPPVLTASAILPKELMSGPNFQVEDKVINDGYMNTYRIKSKFATFRAPSTDWPKGFRTSSSNPRRPSKGRERVSNACLSVPVRVFAVNAATPKTAHTRI
ncbi:MAG: hypothetical protein OEU36_20605 [Gammaproteobacteria bacterium]|nr:hypothetical protein [Gammaproteobacteria bacterium]